MRYSGHAEWGKGRRWSHREVRQEIAEQKRKSAKRTEKERSGQNGKEAAATGVWKASQRTFQEGWGSDPADPSRISY